jgi:hypothetical protein
MPPGKSPRFWARSCSILALVLTCAAAAPTAAAAPSRPHHGDLSPRLAELAKPSVRSAPRAKQAREVSLPVRGPGSLLREGNRVLVEVRFHRGAMADVDDLRRAGAKIVNVSTRYQTVTVAAKPSELRRLSAIPGALGASPMLTPIVSESTCPSGGVVSEGDVQLRAAEARASKVGIDGSGVTVGILSDSFDQAEQAADESGPVATHQAEDVESGDLPGATNTCPGQATPVNVLDDSETEGEDEGRAMGQIVHDLAPGSQLAFATAFTGEIAFAESIEALAKSPGEGGAGAQVIVDDVSYFEEPFFQEGPVGTAASKVTAAGVSYFSSAGNNNLIDGERNIASWEAPEFRNAGGCPAGLPPYASECMDFAPGAAVDPTFGIRVSPNATLRVDLQWAQPWDGVTTDLDAYLLDASNDVVSASEEFNVANTQKPFEFVAWTNNASVSQTVRLAIDRCGPSCDNVTGGDTESPRLKLALLQNGGGVTATEYESSVGGDIVGPTIFGHNGGEDVTSVAAIPFNTTESPEPYSSLGPVTHRFGPVNGVTAAEPLVPAGILSKPDLTASDCNVTTFFAFEAGPSWRFCGTSAAAPHAAAVAALMLQEVPTATPQQIRQALQEGASPIGAFGPCAIGAGLVDAVEAIAALLAPGAGSPPTCAPPESEEPEPEPEPEPQPQPPKEERSATGAPPVIPPPPEAPGPAPQTRFVRHPAKVIRTATGTAPAVFRFGASESGVTFICRVDKGQFHRCEPRLVRRFALGAHVVRVFARTASGVADPTPAVFRFRVEPLE